MFVATGDMDAAATVSGILAGLEEAAGAGPDGDVRARTFRRSAARRRAISLSGACIGQGGRIRRCRRFVIRPRISAFPTSSMRSSQRTFLRTPGSCFVLEALERRTCLLTLARVVADVLSRAARAAFADVLVIQTGQVIAQQQIYS